MKAVVFEDKYKVSVIDKPIPEINDPNEVVVKVKYLGLCGSDLHYYRGHIPLEKGHTMGHEFIGTVIEKGKIAKFDIGDEVISTFTIQCGECWYCIHGYSGICDKTNTFGKIALEGAQAEYVKVPFANYTLVKKPSNDIDDSVYVLMSDIFITGYFGVDKINKFIKSENLEKSQMSILQLGAGPVGLCSVAILKEMGFGNIVVVDSVPERLTLAEKYGATTVINFAENANALGDYIAKQTNNLGFDAVLEIVGAKSALQTAFQLCRRNGFISSVGMGHDDLPFNGLDCYAKSINISFGRCHAWSLFNDALHLFEKVKFSLADLIEVKPSIDEAPDYYHKFEKQLVGKVVFDLSK